MAMVIKSLVMKAIEMKAFNVPNNDDGDDNNDGDEGEENGSGDGEEYRSTTALTLAWRP